jgi:exodeoxyribonuclease VII large subunit
MSFPVVTLLDLCRHFRRVVEANYPKPVWVRAEINQANDSRGNRYMTLIEKEGPDIVARLEAFVWAAQLAELRARHGGLVDEILSGGRQAQLFLQIQYNERYGLKALVVDFEPAFTVGQAALQRQAVLENLQRENLLARNRRHVLPLFPQRIAVVSSEQAAGLQDFLRQLEGNNGGYAFRCTFFNAAVQGPTAPAEIAARIREINAAPGGFDCVALIRGGGSKLDLVAFDDESLCRAVADCALPVLTGIGHEIDESLADLVAHTAFKTPTAVAAFLIERGTQVDSALHHLEHRIARSTDELLQSNRLRIENLALRLQTAPRQILRQAEWRLENIEKSLRLLDPRETLKRGFWLVEKNGRPLLPEQIATGDTLELVGTDRRWKITVAGPV